MQINMHVRAYFVRSVCVCVCVCVCVRARVCVQRVVHLTANQIHLLCVNPHYQKVLSITSSAQLRAIIVLDGEYIGPI